MHHVCFTTLVCACVVGVPSIPCLQHRGTPIASSFDRSRSPFYAFPFNRTNHSGSKGDSFSGSKTRFERENGPRLVVVVVRRRPFRDEVRQVVERSVGCAADVGMRGLLGLQAPEEDAESHA